MQIDAIGLIALAFGVAGCVAGSSFLLSTFIASTTLGAAAAVILTSLGGASIQPPHLLLGFLALSSLLRRGSLQVAVQALAFPKAGFWILLTAAVAVISAIFLPRLFAGATYVFAIARTEIGPGLIAIPLRPTSANITQTLYFLGDVVCFLVFYIYACNPEMFRITVAAILGLAALNIVFAILDLTTYWTHTQFLLSPIRNANYRMLDDTAIVFKRIVGSFPEASAFAYFTLGLFAFCMRLWLANAWPLVTGPLALLSFGALTFSTSSTGYAGTCGFLATLFVSSCAQALTRPVSRSTLAFVAATPLLLSAFLVTVRLDDQTWGSLRRFVDATIVDKLSTDSGRERIAWNERALTNFEETNGFGAGVGSVRASSFPVAVLGQIGVIGAFTYGSFLLTVLLGRRNRWTEPWPAACQSAARWACLAQLMGASVAGSFLDLDLLFFVFAGLSCAGPESRRVHFAAPLPVAAV